MIYLTQEEFDAPISDDGMSRGDLLDYQGIDYTIIE